MKELVASLTRHGGTIPGTVWDFGEWDVGVGLDKTIYLTNPNSYVKANLKGIKNKDSRVKVELPDEILPNETEPARIKIAAIDLQTMSEVDIEAFFKATIDSLAGKIKWQIP